MVAAGTPALVDMAVSAAAASAATWAQAMPSVEPVPAASPAAHMELAHMRPVLIRAATIEAAHYGRSSAFGRGSFGRYGRNHSGIGVRIRSYPYGYNCWGGNCGYGGYGGWGYPYLGGGIDPYWWWDNGDSDSDSSADQPAPYYGSDDGLANQMQQQGIPMRPVPDYGSQDYDPNYNPNYHARSTPPVQPQQQEHTQAAPATVLVFRDQHQEQVQNYAIVAQTLWNFTSGHTQKIPLSDLDIPATQKANEDQGVEFRLPASSEGQ